jgi:hypothetical protein
MTAKEVKRFLDRNQLSGSLPDEMASLVNLETLYCYSLLLPCTSRYANNQLHKQIFRKKPTLGRGSSPCSRQSFETTYIVSSDVGIQCPNQALLGNFKQDSYPKQVHDQRAFAKLSSCFWYAYWSRLHSTRRPLLLWLGWSWLFWLWPSDPIVRLNPSGEFKLTVSLFR